MVIVSFIVLSAITTAALAIFWLGYYLANGSVPTNYQAPMADAFVISRWWDILIGPIWTAVLIFSLASLTDDKFKKKMDGMVAGLAAGWILSLAMGLYFGIICVLTIGIMIILAFALGHLLIEGIFRFGKRIRPDVKWD